MYHLLGSFRSQVYSGSMERINQSFSWWLIVSPASVCNPDDIFYRWLIGGSIDCIQSAASKCQTPSKRRTNGRTVRPSVRLLDGVWHWPPNLNGRATTIRPSSAPRFAVPAPHPYRSFLPLPHFSVPPGPFPFSHSGIKGAPWAREPLPIEIKFCALKTQNNPFCDAPNGICSDNHRYARLNNRSQFWKRGRLHFTPCHRWKPMNTWYSPTTEKELVRTHHQIHRRKR